MRRIGFFIDGFNVYHSIKQALSDGLAKAKWLDYRKMCESYLHSFDADPQLAEIHYFSAYATFLPDPGVVIRHQLLVKALQNSGIKVTLGNFKRRTDRCKVCNSEYSRHEEKESDVNIAIALLEAMSRDTCDIGVLVTGDTDLVAAARSAKRLYPDKQVSVLFPYKRHNNHWESVVDTTRKIKKDKYAACQFPDAITLADGSILKKPPTW